MRTFYDSVNAAAIPTNVSGVLGYVDGAYAWTEADWARFPDGVAKVGIAVFASTMAGTVLDVERGDATPDQAPNWVVRRRSSGVDPWVYCNLSTWDAVIAAFNSAGVDQPHYWIAHYDGIAEIPRGALGKQYVDPPASGGNYDLSVFPDYIPGVDVTQPDTKNALVAYGRTDALTHMKTAVDFGASAANGEIVELVETLNTLVSLCQQILTKVSQPTVSGTFSITGSGTIS